jgi:AmiR/NasT family two-component response regulator
MDGLAATRSIVETCPTCVVMVTGNSALEDAAAESGAMGFVVKPPGRGIASVVETARERFECFRAIREHATDTEEALTTWGLAWSAAKALVREQGMSEADARSELKRSAQGQGVSIRVAAEQVLARS